MHMATNQERTAPHPVLRDAADREVVLLALKDDLRVELVDAGKVRDCSLTLAEGVAELGHLTLDLVVCAEEGGAGDHRVGVEADAHRPLLDDACMYEGEEGAAKCQRKIFLRFRQGLNPIPLPESGNVSTAWVSRHMQGQVEDREWASFEYSVACGVRVVPSSHEVSMVLSLNSLVSRSLPHNSVRVKI